MITDAMVEAALKVLREAPEVNLKWTRVALEAAEAARWQPLTVCPHCGRREPVDSCHMGGCPLGADL